MCFLIFPLRRTDGQTDSWKSLYSNELKNIKNVENTTKHELDSHVNILLSSPFILKRAEQSAYLMTPRRGQFAPLPFGTVSVLWIR